LEEHGAKSIGHRVEGRGQDDREGRGQTAEGRGQTAEIFEFGSRNAACNELSRVEVGKERQI